MILHLGFDVGVEADKVMKHIAQLCTSQVKKASQSVYSLLVASRNEQDCVAGSGTVPPLGWQDSVSPLARGQYFLPERISGRPRRTQLGPQPRPTKGILVAMIVMNRMSVSNGRSAMWSTARATCCTSITGSTAREPFACGTPRVMTDAISVRALPMSICPQAMSYGLPSKAVDLVRPVIACLVAV